MEAYYNEIDPFASQWLVNLVAARAVAPGFVDSRSIVEVSPEDLASYTQCHFFAGIGVWSYALKQSGWPDTLPVWTGSCPCQPFSVAGKRKGFSDQRHLWPNWFRLISICQPPIIFGEQVASPDGLAWLDNVQSDLENAGYAFAAVDTCAAGFGAPHLRQRLYWVAITRSERCEGLRLHLRQRQEGPRLLKARRSSQATAGFWSDAEWLLGRDGKTRPIEPGTFPLAARAAGDLGRLRAYGNSLCAPQAIGFVEAVMETICEP
jgi:DNA (cytosine-5)-methyltransferase 1